MSSLRWSNFWKKKFKMANSKKISFSSSANSQYFFMKFTWFGPWVSRIDWCEGYWCGSTYMVVRLSDISSKTGKICVFVFLGCFWAYVGQPHNHTNASWSLPMPFASINYTKPRTNPWTFHEKILRIDTAGKWGFFETAIFFCLSQWKKQPIYMRYHFFCTMDGFYRILEKKLSKLSCTRL